MDEDKKKSSVWLYAVILFFSAFIVLVFAGYSQIRLNKSLDNYKSQVFNTESEREMYQQHFASAQEMNEELNKEIDSLKNEISGLINEVSKLEDSNTELESEYQKREAETVKLSGAASLFLEGKPEECVDMVKSIDIAYLNENSVKMMNVLKQKGKC
jgi:septal ring factor EnvC (AmiA/AmiB activator)